ncbi:succinate dehydrogenase cytochrome b subunit [Nafulsella turpanensis]|uniref:succinate dehydrogenase cytochrome b subunit n=1 Tax=Nafulsella turpanensis TaxID=1265690 RepID=UPI000476075A|nr:succinate dehydrogenase cytochrome b subunit [Nafulsella turpanensis]
MSWITQTFSSTIGRKLLVAASGLFLIIFLIGHVSGNFLLFKDDGGQAFNEYTQFMTTNQLVQVVRWLTYISILTHIIVTIILTIHNKKARPVGYAEAHPSANSTWSSRNMGLLGTLIAVFLVIHLGNFWYKMKVGEVPLVTYESEGTLRDLYSVVLFSFSNLWYVILYVVMMIFLALHLAHGFRSAFQTLGWRHKKYTPIIEKVGLAFAIIVPLLFAIMPVYIYIITR